MLSAMDRSDQVLRAKKKKTTATTWGAERGPGGATRSCFLSSPHADDADGESPILPHRLLLTTTQERRSRGGGRRRQHHQQQEQRLKGALAVIDVDGCITADEGTSTL